MLGVTPDSTGPLPVSGLPYPWRAGVVHAAAVKQHAGEARLGTDGIAPATPINPLDQSQGDAGASTLMIIKRPNI